MTKYRVILANGSAEFSDLPTAQTFSDNNGGIRIDTITEADPVAPDSIAIVELWQFRAAVQMAGKTTAVDNYLASLTGNQKIIATNLWQYGNTVDAMGAFVKLLKNGMGLTKAQIINIFTTASGLDVS